MANPKVASPYATGGGGVDFETAVGAFYLAQLLHGGLARGQTGGTVQQVQFQRLFQGQPLDDLLIVSGLGTGTAKLALQVKRDLKFSRKNSDFVRVIGASWDTFTSPDFSDGTDQFGVALGLYSKTIAEHYQSVLTWARNSATASDFVTRLAVPKLASNQQRTFLTLIRTILDAHVQRPITDEELWRFLRSMVILHFDFQDGGSRDYASAIHLLLSTILGGEKLEAQKAFSTLLTYSAEAKRTAGSLDRPRVVERLAADGFSIVPAVDYKPDIERLKDHGEFVLRDIKTDIGGVELDRTAMIFKARELQQNNSLLQLVGPSGIGKSALLKTLATRSKDDGSVIILSGDRITANGWDAFAADLRLIHGIRNILLTLSGAGNVSVFIDGIDKIIEDGPRRVINDLLYVLADLNRERAGATRLIVTARDENLQELHTWLRWDPLGQSTRFSVPGLTREEVGKVVEAIPRLQSIASLRHLEPITTNPFMLSILGDARMPTNAGQSAAVATEVDLCSAWWEHVIGSGSTGTARQEAVLELGRRTMGSHWLPVPAQGLDPFVVDSLRNDQILSRLPNRDVYRFRHDLMEDWIVFRVLDSHREQLPSYLKEFGPLHGLYRPLQLLGANMLEEGHEAQWGEVLEQLDREVQLSSRWKQAFLTAPLSSTRAEDLLHQVQAFLLADQGKRLAEMLVAVRTVEVLPDLTLLPFVTSDDIDADAILPLLMSRPIPIWRTWTPLVGWILSIEDQLSEEARLEVASMLETWQKKSPLRSKYRTEIGKLAMKWIKSAGGPWAI